jgi:hypothetical protein
VSLWRGVSSIEITVGLAAVLAATASGGVPEAEWRQLAAEHGVDADAVLSARDLMRVFGGDVLTTSAGRDALAQYRSAQVAAEAPEPRAAAKRRVEVTDHAIERALRRHSAGRAWDEMRWAIRRDVSAALAAGRVANHKPRWWPLMHGERRAKRQMPAGQRFAWNESRSRGFVLTRGTHGEDLVLTCLHRVAPLTDAAPDGRSRGTPA